MRPGSRVPRAVAAAGCGGTGPELALFGDLGGLDALLVGPVGEPPGTQPAEAPPALRAVPGAVVHSPAPVIPVERMAQEHLPWLRARGVRVVVAIRARSGGTVADVVGRLRRALDFEAVTGLELDLRGALSTDPQEVLRLMARLREAAPRDLPLAAKLGPDCPELVAVARASIAGGAGVLVVSGAVPTHPEGTWLAGPATGPVTDRLVVLLRQAMAAGRVPQVPVLAGGGVHDEASAVRLCRLGAAGVQVGSALLADPGLLWRVHRAVAAAVERDEGDAAPKDGEVRTGPERDGVGTAPERVGIEDGGIGLPLTGGGLG